jgi:tetratricopeptide (TPR) repeat protein
MLHPRYLVPGSRIELPELAQLPGCNTSAFDVLSVHAGGMGVCVCLRSQDGTRYALKSVRPELLGDADGLARFHDELVVWLSAAACDGVADAISVVRINETPSVVAPWADGGDLAHAFPTLTPALRFQTIIRTIRALSWTHEQLGVVHRDLKPANILLDSERLSYVSDWGLARPLRATLQKHKSGSAAHLDRPDRTQAGSFLGTVVYAAPEQLLDATTVDHRADMYSLGCIMFELETGSPPFGGATVREIAQKHLEAEPPRLGGLFRKTSLGLEKIIARSLAKRPDQRYAAYRELEQEVLAVAVARSFPLERCVIGKRHTRHVLGEGGAAQQRVLAGRFNANGYALADASEIGPFIEEAEHLIAVSRFKEAEVLLRPHYLPEWLRPGTGWHLGLSLALNYAYCLQNIGRASEALAIYSKLSTAKEPPAELFINYSLALLHSGKASDAKAVCERGLAHFPDDLDLLGNYTLALTVGKELDAARRVAMRRLKMRRDVHSLQEAAAVLAAHRDAVRNGDLPEAMRIAKDEHHFIREGLALNPRFMPLVFAEIALFRFAASSRALDTCRTLFSDTDVSPAYRWLAFSEYVSELASGDDWKAALENINKHLDSCNDRSVREALLFTKWNLYADKYMVGKDTRDGARVLIKEVVQFFLERDEGSSRYPLVSARVLEWMSRAKEAEPLLRRGIAARGKDAWEFERELAFLLVRARRHDEALATAEVLVAHFPWRAATWDALSWVAGQVGNAERATKAKQQGDVVFEKELALFKEFRGQL